MPREDVKALVDQLYAASDEREIKKLNLFAELLLDKEHCERVKAEAERQGVPFCEYVNEKFEKALSDTEQKNQQGGT